MFYPDKEIILKDGRTALLRAPSLSDAAGLLEYMKITAAETPFLLRTPEEVTMTVENEERYLSRSLADPNSLMILCFVEGELAGNCNLSRRTKKKNAHRGSLGIALVKEFWNLGIGTALLSEIISAARDWGLHQLELEVIEGNDRAMALYRKLGFETVGFTPDAIRTEDGRYVKEFLMVKRLK